MIGIAERDNLRRQRVDMRAQLVGNLCRRIEAGDLALLGGIHAALVALDELQVIEGQAPIAAIDEAPHC